MNNHKISNLQNQNDSSSDLQIISPSNSSAFSYTEKNYRAKSTRKQPLYQPPPRQLSLTPTVSVTDPISSSNNTNVITLIEYELGTLRKVSESTTYRFLNKLLPNQQPQANHYISLYRSIVKYITLVLNKEDRNKTNNGLYSSGYNQGARYSEILNNVIRVASQYSEDLGIGIKIVMERTDVKDKILKARLKNKESGPTNQSLQILSNICLKPKSQSESFNSTTFNVNFKKKPENNIRYVPQVNFKQRATIKNMKSLLSQKITSNKCLICDKQLTPPNTLISTNHHIFKCQHCGRQFHKSCNPRHYNCIFCQIRNINPMHETKKQLFIGIIRKNTKRHEIMFKFEDTDNIVPEKYQNVGINADNTQTLEVRSLRVKDYYDPNSSYTLLFPDACAISVNGRLLKEFIPLHRQSSLKYRRDQPVKIMSNINLKKGQNTVSIVERFMKRDLKPEERVQSENHLIGIYILQDPIPTPKELITRYQTLPFQKSEELLKKSLLMKQDQSGNTRAEEELECENAKISLKCSLTLLKMEYPGRSIFCNHFTCFDVYNFIILNSQTNLPKWQCPICKVPAYQFRIDPILKGILNLINNLDGYNYKEKTKAKKQWIQVVFSRNMKFMIIDSEGNQGQIASIYDLTIEQFYKRKDNSPLQSINQQNMKHILQDDGIRNQENKLNLTAVNAPKQNNQDYINKQHQDDEEIQKLLNQKSQEFKNRDNGVSSHYVSKLKQQKEMRHKKNFEVPEECQVVQLSD